VCAGATLFCIAAFSSPLSFTPQTQVVVEQGAPFGSIARQLADSHIISSKNILRAFVALWGGASRVQAGTYLFGHPEGALSIAYRLTHGQYGFSTVRVVFPEGTTVAQMGAILSRQLHSFDAETFEQSARSAEGYLFPDTYFFSEAVSPEDVIRTLADQFEQVRKEFAPLFASSTRSLSDIVIMASILEEEAKTFRDKQIVAGILWKRLDIGMALQVDATFADTLGKTSHELTAEDLKTDSPYNTYTRAGLPPTPISNPGRESLQAALTPVKTPYFYYLSGTDGQMHYAATLEEHVANKRLYLKQ
jgi:UPF0755 protein